MTTLVERFGAVAAANLFLLAGALILFFGSLVGGVVARARAARRSGRRKVYEDALSAALAGGGELSAALEARSPSDEGLVDDALLAVLRRTEGAGAGLLREAAARRGLVERKLRGLASTRREERVRAMQALGLLRAKQAVAPMLSSFDGEPLEVKLVALKALADIGDPASVAHFVSAAYVLPRYMVVALASLLLRQGPPGRRGVQTLIARFPASFPPRVMMEVLRAAAADGGGPL